MKGAKVSADHTPAERRTLARALNRARIENRPHEVVLGPNLDCPEIRHLAAWPDGQVRRPSVEEYNRFRTFGELPAVEGRDT